MTLPHRIDLLVRLGEYMENNNDDWLAAKEKANRMNPWFIPEFIDRAAANISNQFLKKELLEQWVMHYNVPKENTQPATVGIVMAGNIPMVGFHDMLCLFITGHRQVIKLSSKDSVLIKHLVDVMTEWNTQVGELISFAENLKRCDAYIATGSNNSGRYFEYYFGKYPHIIRKNRTSVAILDGTETEEELSALADDIQLFFGLGCRNVTKVYIPKEYNFEALLNALNKYGYLSDFHKYRNNYDYQMALLMMNNKYYMTNDHILLAENSSHFSPISQINYEFYSASNPPQLDRSSDEIQCVVGHNRLPFGSAQTPSLTDYADGIDTMWFAMSL